MKKKYAILLGLYSILLGLLCLGSSPFIDYMTPDSSIFWAIGRSMANGKIAYKEVFDHKGFYLWVLNWIGAVVSTKSTIGLFLVEVMFNYANAILVFTIASFYVEEDAIRFFSAITFLGITMNYFTCRTGNLTEYYGVTFQLISILLILKYYRSGEKKHPVYYMFIHGLCSGILLYMQANIVGMWIPFGIILAVQMFRDKQVGLFIINLIGLLGGVLCASIPVFLYGIRFNCLNELLFGTFEANIKYSKVNREGTSFAEFLRHFVMQPVFIIVVLAIVSMVLVWKYERTLCLMFSLMFLSTVIFMNVALRANENYYHSYIVFLLPTVIFMLNKLFSNVKKYTGFFVVGIFTVSVMVNMQFVKQVLHIGQSHVVYQASHEIKKMINPDDKMKDELVVTGCQAMIYNETNTIPQIKYFVTFGGGLHYDVFPDAVEMQRDAVLSNQFRYVAVQFGNNNQIYGIQDIDKEIMDHVNENYNRKYEIDESGIHIVLFERKD